MAAAARSQHRRRPGACRGHTDAFTPTVRGVAVHASRGSENPSLHRRKQSHDKTSRRSGVHRRHRATLVAHPARRHDRRDGPGRPDRFAAVRGDTRLRATSDDRSSVAMVSYRGNRYSVPLELPPPKSSCRIRSMAAATGRPHRRKERIPPGPAAKAAAAQLLALKKSSSTAIETSTPSTDSTVVDLYAYERAAQNRSIQ